MVALLSCEAKYIATTTAATQTMWMSRMLAELLGRKVDVVELKVDSKSALALAKNHVFHERSKHICIKYHFIRDCLEDGSIKASHITSIDQLAKVQVPRDEGEDRATVDLSTRLRGRLIDKPSARHLYLTFPAK